MVQKNKNIKKAICIAIILIITIISNANLLKSCSTEIDAENELETTFTLYNQDGETYEPIEGTKFVITDLEGKNAIDINGQIVGEKEIINEIEYYVLTTDKNGCIKANLPKGLYKAIEITINESYKFEENQENRTYYFEIGVSTLNIPEWINGIRGYSWNNIKSTIVNKKGEVLVVGSISEYLPEIAQDYYNGVDLNSDNIIEKTSNGNEDGIIISYDEKGNYMWSKTFGGNDDECFNEIIQTSDGGYALVGYTSSTKIYLDGKLITQLSKGNYDLKNKDGFILKIDEQGNYQWSTKIGGTLDDEIIKIIETTDKNLNIIGNFCSNQLNFYENNANYNIVENIKNEGKQNSFISSYTIDGKYNWSQNLSGQDYIQICDITEIDNSLAIIANYRGNIKIGNIYEEQSHLLEYKNGIIINFSLNGEFKWYYDIYSAPKNIYANYKYMNLTAITTTQENELAVALSCTEIIKGKKYGNQEHTTIYECESDRIYANILKFSSQGEFRENIYNLAGQTPTTQTTDATVIIKDIISTKNNHIIIGGYYYSTKSIDVDKDGLLNGEYDFKSTTVQKPNGFLIKLDQKGNVNFSNCIYRSDRETYSSSSINSISQINDKKIIAVGNFDGQTITTKNFYNQYKKEETYEKYYLNRVGNIDSFVFMENIGEDNIEIIQPEKITVNNTKKEYKITTEVKSHIEIINGQDIQIKGGNISGQYNQTIDGFFYTEEGIHYVETVKHGGNSEQEIIITPDEGYKIQKIMINDEEYTNYVICENGEVILPKYTNITEDIHIEVTFDKKIINFYKLPVTGAKEILIIDIMGLSLISIGLLKILKIKK